MRFKLAIIIFFLGLTSSAYTQDTVKVDTTRTGKPKYAHSPKKAAVFSAVVPGLGQAYNKKWWKIPIVYAAIGTSTGFIVYNQQKYTKFKQAYIDRLNDPLAENEFSQYSTNQLFDIQDTYHRWRDISIMVTAGFYILNIVDASVDAHFFRFDVGDDLSFSVLPHLNFVKPGLSICLRF